MNVILCCVLCGVVVGVMGWCVCDDDGCICCGDVVMCDVMVCFKGMCIKGLMKKYVYNVCVVVLKKCVCMEVY